MKNLIVKKPWGEEYVICKTKNTATWLLKINPKKKTSLHCHPKKKTGFILLKGKVEVMLGFYERKILTAPDKLMIRPGLFHCTRSLSKNDCIIFEVETPINKNDLVRYKDDYGRANKPYESRKLMKKIKDEVIFNVPKNYGKNSYNINNMEITVEKIKSKKKLMSNRTKNTIFAILNGGLVDKRKQYVLSAGDIVKTNTIKKLTDVFNIKKEIEVLTVKKK